MSVPRPAGVLLAGVWTLPASGFVAATFPPSSSGRGARLSKELPVGMAPVEAADRKSGCATAGLEPRNDTPRNAAPRPDDEAGTLAPVPAGEPGGGDAVVGVADGDVADMGEAAG